MRRTLLTESTDKQVLGVCGLIGSGKSVVMKYLQLQNVPAFDCDGVAKEAYFDHDMQPSLIALLGQSPIIEPEHKLNKQLLQEALASGKKIALEELTHRYVMERFRQFLLQSSATIVALESAILFSSGFYRLCDHILYVTAPLDVRKGRVLARDKDAPDPERRFDNIVAIQKNEEDAMIEHAEMLDFKVVNDDQQPIIPQVERILEAIR